MTLLLLALFGGLFIFLFYYELIWKKVEHARGKSLLSMARDFAFQQEVRSGAMPEAVPASYGANPWNDWKYRLLVEFHRRGELRAEEAVKFAGASVKEVEEYLDLLEGEGKVRQAGDAERGIFYRIVNEG